MVVWVKYNTVNAHQPNGWRLFAIGDEEARPAGSSSVYEIQ